MGNPSSAQPLRKGGENTMLESLAGTLLLFYCAVALVFFLFMIVLLVVGEVKDRKSSILSTREQFAAMVMAVIALAIGSAVWPVVLIWLALPGNRKG